MKEIDWSEAPVWADRVACVGSWGRIVWADSEKYCYVGEINKFYYFDMPGTWNIKELIDVQYRPTPWQGPQDGLPPVGSVVEFCVDTTGEEVEWQKDLKQGMHVEIIAHFDARAKKVAAFVFECPNGIRQVEQGIDRAFRPIQSERDKAVQAACELVQNKSGKYNTHIDCSVAMRATVEVLYDDGMLVDPERKPMSRAEAKAALLAKSPNPFVSIWADEALDALGYKD